MRTDQLTNEQLERLKLIGANGTHSLINTSLVIKVVDELLMRRSNAVYLLSTLYPCASWKVSDPHGPSENCLCEEFFEGVFDSPETCKAYIPKWLDEKHDGLLWYRTQPQLPELANQDVWASETVADNTETMRYIYQKHEVMRLDNMETKKDDGTSRD